MSTFKALKQILLLAIAVILCTGCAGSRLPALEVNPWQIMTLPTQSNLLDISFSSANHGWVVGTNAAVFETTDGGLNWQQKQFELDEGLYRFTSVSFVGQEGWIVGEPLILLHTTDEGRSWTQIPLSNQLPGVPYLVRATGARSAEMATSVGAIYSTTDGGQNWKALTQDAFGVVRNISRSADGRYVAVSAKGSFYSTWAPGEKNWVGHNRTSSRRLENMGYGSDGRLWMISRGGQLQFSQPNTLESWDEPISPEYSNNSWGFLDLAYRTNNEIWVAGGSGNLLCSFDGGHTWQKDWAVENVPSNLIKIVFFGPNKGFILGQRGTLLRYDNTTKA